jgi:hypothetical protein
VILGTAIGGFGVAASVSRTEPRWLAGLGVLGGALLIACAVPALAVAQGSAWVLLGLGGFVCWLVWVTATSLTLLRDSSRQDAGRLRRQ